MTQTDCFLSDQQKEELVPLFNAGKCVPVRFFKNGRCLNISNGLLMEKSVNIINQYVYWQFSKETALKIANMLNVKAVFSE